jgi:hypothetical protein
LEQKSWKQLKKRETPEQSIAVGFWDAYGEWLPNTPAHLAKVALLALERDGWIVIKGERNE